MNSKHHPYFPWNDDRTIVKHYNTIGDFYLYILNVLGKLTDCGRNNSIFTGNPSKQVDSSYLTMHGHGLKVIDYPTAVEAIHDIVEQGEGSSPCNPVAWDEGAKNLSHYFLFHSIAEKHEIQVSASPPEINNHDKDSGVVDYSEVFSLECFSIKRGTVLILA